MARWSREMGRQAGEDIGEEAAALSDDASWDASHSSDLADADWDD